MTNTDQTYTQTMFPVQIHTASSKAEKPSHRLCTISWKQTEKMTKAGKVAHANRCVSIPAISLDISPASIKDALQQAFYEMQDTVIREKLETALDAKKQPEPILLEDISPEAIAAWAAETATGGKLSIAKIDAWFASNLLEQLQEALATEPEMDDEKLARQTASYKEAFCKLASPTANVPTHIAAKMLLRLSLAADDTVTKQLGSKLKLFLEPAKNKFEDLL